MILIEVYYCVYSAIGCMPTNYYMLRLVNHKLIINVKSNQQYVIIRYKS